MIHASTTDLRVVQRFTEKERRKGTWCGLLYVDWITVMPWSNEDPDETVTVAVSIQNV